MNKKLSLTFFIISLLLLVLSIFMPLIIYSNKPYINKSSITYELDYVKDDMGNFVYDENNNFVYNVTSIQIEIINPSFKKIDNLKVALKYCREDEYPEAYTTPVVISLNSFEKKIITISNFRNPCIFNENYHIRSDWEVGSDKNSYLSVKYNNNEIEIVTASFVILPISIILLTFSIIGLSKKTNKDKE